MQVLSEKHLKSLLSFAFIIFLTACSVVPVIDQWKNLENNNWNRSQKVKIPVTISDSDHYYNIAVNLRVTNDYKYSNLWMKLHIKDPQGKLSSEQIMLNLADHRGKWTGHNLGNIVSFRLPVIKDKVFNRAGIYNFYLEQYMRDSVLKEVVSAGVQLEMQKAILK